MGFAQVLRLRRLALAGPSAMPQREPRRHRARPRARITAHPIFAPVLGTWGAAVAALSIVVLPSRLIEVLAVQLVPEFAAGFARLVLALGAAAFMGLMCFAAARLVARRGGHAAPTVRPIDPASELGSASFDAPLPDALSADDADWDETPTDLMSHALWEEAPETARDLRMPDLSLEEFGDLPGRNAVWLEEGPEPKPEQEMPVRAPQSVPTAVPAVPAAVAKLRAVPLAELSLCHMVERFAAALQDYQAVQEAHGPDLEDRDREQREAVLNEALKALALVTRNGLAEMRATGAGAEPASDRRRMRSSG
jgi:hypothetical protein